MIEAILFVGGLLLGVLVARWWALLAAPGLGVWIATVSEVDEVPPAFLGVVYAVISGLGIAAGVGLRRHGKINRSPGP